WLLCIRLPAIQLSPLHREPQPFPSRHPFPAPVPEPGDPEGAQAPKVRIAVDHIIELQVAPAWMRDAFDSVDNYELLTETAKLASRNRIRTDVNAERRDK